MLILALFLCSYMTARQELLIKFLVLFHLNVEKQKIFFPSSVPVSFKFSMGNSSVVQDEVAKERE